MVRYIKDKTGRFDTRPYYEPEELDSECEKIITDLMTAKFGGMKLPIPTDALTVLIEQDVENLDIYADLSSLGDSVEGVTDFFSGKKPKVRISDSLSGASNLENRFRTTLTHEYGHVKFHNYLFSMEKSFSLFPDANEQKTHHCKRDTIVNASRADWMEWQAGYVCGSILMPHTRIKNAVIDFRSQRSSSLDLALGVTNTHTLINQIASTFRVSEEAAKIRLLKLTYITDQKDSVPLLK